MNVNGIGATGYPAAGKAKVRQAQDGTQSFDREFMGMASQTPPSFVGKVWTKEGTRARFRFAGKDKIYTFDVYYIIGSFPAKRKVIADLKVKDFSDNFELLYNKDAFSVKNDQGSIF